MHNQNFSVGETVYLQAFVDLGIKKELFLCRGIILEKNFNREYKKNLYKTHIVAVNFIKEKEKVAGLLLGKKVTRDSDKLYRELNLFGAQFYSENEWKEIKQT